MKIRRNRLEPTAEATVTVNIQPVSRHNEYFHKALGVDNTQEAVYEELHIVGVRKNAGPDGADVVTEETGHAFVPKTPEAFTHDADGNLTSDGRWTYTWDAENRLVGVETAVSAVTAGAPEQKLEFSYDFQSRRISKKVYEWNGASGEWQVAGDLRFVYDGWNLVAELDATPAPVRTHTWGLDLSGSEQGAGGVGGLLFTTTHAPAASTRFVSFDGNGNVSALLNVESGVTSAEYEYDPFGNTLRADGPATASNPFRFSTHYFDGETVLVYAKHRYYQPSTGRWVSRDPLAEMGGINVFTFVYNDSLNFTDSFGLQCTTCCGPDVTHVMNRLLDEVDKTFAMIQDASKSRKACVALLDPTTAGNAWDVEALKELGFSAAFYKFNSGRQGTAGTECKRTVAYDGKCYQGRDVNYLLWGRAMRLCFDRFGAGEETASDYMTTEHILKGVAAAHDPEAQSLAAMLNDPAKKFVFGNS
jgi:RHS repeat-associated protein